MKTLRDNNNKSNNKKRTAAAAPSRLLILASAALQLLSIHHHVSCASSFAPTNTPSLRDRSVVVAAGVVDTDSTTTTVTATATTTPSESSDKSALFEEFASFLQTQQSEIIEQIEQLERDMVQDEETAGTFTRDCWGVFEREDDDSSSSTSIGSGGITRVIQKGAIIEKGACSLTLLRNGKLTAERAASIRGRQNNSDGISIQEGDTYCAAALSMVLHTRSPMVPTFRSDVRIFLVESSSSASASGAGSDQKQTVAWFGGGSDLTPYYLFDEDISFFHGAIKDLCEQHSASDDQIDYPTMKRACDDYFFLPARSEHRGVGGMFYDDLPATPETLAFCRDVASGWMPSWFPIVTKRQPLPYNEQQREWQLLRRGRYLEFNLLYDRGVKFGLANANPRVEGVMVSAPPLIAWEYNHQIEPGSEEDRLMAILKAPIDWV
mmetsp:Transcript_19351/g.53947  ORF Transcript_19351/g.53947 Transcript_19351/m.53947 type:complete len:436 (-) Transcript_19351:41-1348(-)|eukprot:CAMPEP_0172361738 /NCGR_PEP_ID=MMETSP1060-20121228/5525_1 /TAXON_ID=37318 /ORGANISM="Pseudo-nitzschia pungens, Strain cf. cingulata" /LENGTH=435 /DNA_ID=CAMNT_0013084099 /DNA_START=50 /DNA_END=1357 /DNA_ORIENTATION=-